MKKILALVLAFVMMFSTMTVAFADVAISADAQACVELGMLKGTDGTVDVAYTATEPTRLQAAIMFLRLKGLEDTAKAFTGTDNFADVKEYAWAEGKAMMAYLKAHPELGWIGSEGNFNPDTKLTAASYYKVMLEALGYKQNTAEVVGDFEWADVLTFAAGKGLSKVAGVVAYTVNDLAIATIETLKTVVNGGTKTLATVLVEGGKLDKAAAVKAGVYEDEVKVESLVAAGAKALKVTFNKAVDTTKAIFTVKRGNIVVSTTAAWNEAKTEATLTSSVNLMSGDYTVTVTGIEIATGKNVATTTISSVKVDSIVLADNAFRTTGTTVTVNYELYNQYGEKVTDNYDVSNYTVTSSKGTVTGAQPTAKGTITITGIADDVKTLTVTIVDEVYAKTASKVVNVQDAKALGTVTLGQPEIPTGKDKISYTSTNVVIPYTAVDQYGEEVTLEDVTGLTIISSNTTVLPVANVKVETIGDDDKLVMSAFGEFEGAKDITLTVIVNATGNVSKVTFTVYGIAAANTPMLVAPTTNPGVDDTANIQLKMYDVYGNEMDADDVAKLTAADVTVISSNTKIFTAATAPALSSKKAVIAVTAKAEGTANLMVTVNATGETSTIAITVVEAKYAASMTLVPDYTYAVPGADITLKATFKDQYGDKIESSDYVVEFTEDNANFGAPADTTVTNMVENGVTYSASAYEKTTKVTVKLYDAESVLLDSKTITLTSIKEDAALTYAVKAIGTIADAAAGALDSAYAVKIEVYAKDASGNKVALTGDEIANALPANDALLEVGAVEGVYYVAGEDVDKDTDTKIFVTVATNAGVKVIEVPVKVSAEAPAALSIKAMAGDDEVTEVELAGLTYADLFNDEADLYFEVKDQYGTTALSANNYVTIFVKSAAGISKVAGDLTFVEDTEYTLTAITANGLSVSVDVVGTTAD